MKSCNLFGTAAVLAGGESRRFGSNKALALWQGKPLLSVITAQLKPLFEDILIVTNSPDQYTDYAFRSTGDILKQKGPSGGIHAALSASRSEYVFLLACDMPYLSAELILHMKRIIEQKHPEAVIACRGDFMEPFHGFYSRTLIPEIEQSVSAGSGSVYSLLKRPGIVKIEDRTIRKYSPEAKIFYNVNRPEDIWSAGN